MSILCQSKLKQDALWSVNSLGPGYLNAHITAHDRQYTAISIKVIPEQSGKMQYDRESLLNFLAIPRKTFALVFDFSALLGENH